MQPARARTGEFAQHLRHGLSCLHVQRHKRKFKKKKNSHSLPNLHEFHVGLRTCHGRNPYLRNLSNLRLLLPIFLFLHSRSREEGDDFCTFLEYLRSIARCRRKAPPSPSGPFADDFPQTMDKICGSAKHPAAEIKIQTSDSFFR